MDSQQPEQGSIVDEPLILEGITVGSRRFANKAALAAFVDELIEHRGGTFDAFETRAIQTLEELGGDVDPEIRRIARATRFYEPVRILMPSPYDERIEEAEARLEEAEAIWQGSLEGRRQVEAEGNQELNLIRSRDARAEEIENALGLAADSLRRRWAEAEIAVEDARRNAERARARLTGLRLAAQQWRNAREARFHNPEDPSKPFTLEQMNERRGK